MAPEAPEAFEPGWPSALLAPRSVAVVGASDTPGKPTSRPVEFLRRHGWSGALFPVNPGKQTVLGEHAWPSLASLPIVPEHVLVVTGADTAVEVVRECAELGVAVVTLVADGYLGSSEAGRERRRRLREILDGSTLRLLGPSSLGVANLHTGLALTGNAAFAEPHLPVGDVFVASQSGSAIGALLSRGVEMGIGFRAMVSTGNEFDLQLGEICLASVDDPQISSYALFLENLEGAQALAAFAHAAAQRGKPVVAYKLGRSAAAAQLAVSHTGALAGEDAVADAFLRDLGIARVNVFEALLEGQHLARRVPPGALIGHAPRVCVVSTTGGGGAMAVDCLASRGAVVGPPQPGTAAKLAGLGVHTDHGGLIDLTLGGTNYDVIRSTLEVVCGAPEFDAVVAVPGSSARFAPEVSVAPVVDCVTGDTPLMAFIMPAAADALATVRRNGISAFRTPESCADATMAVFGRSRPRLREAVGIPADAARTPLDEDESYAALSHLGVRIPRRAVVSCTQLPDELPVPAPAAVKVLSAAIAHKSDVGGVVLGVRDAAGLHAAAASIRESLEAAGLPDACEWLLVQEMADGVGEALIGFRHDPQIGPIVLVSAGGVLAELYRDRSVRPAPVTLAQAREMIAEVRAFATLAGYRGAPKGDLEALAHALSAISRLDPSVAEAEINPLLIGPVGDGVVAVDALLSRFGEVSS